MNIAQLIAFFLTKIDTTGSGLTSGQDVIDSLNAIANRSELKGAQITINTDSGNSYFRVNDLNNFAKVESGDGEDVECSIICEVKDGLNKVTIYSTDGTNQSKIEVFAGGNVVLSTVTSGDITLNSAEQINLIAGTILEATIGGQLNVTTGDSSTINVGGEFILKSLLSKVKIHADNQTAEIQSVNANTRVLVDGINGRVFLNATQGHYVFANVPSYANDAAADADSGLLSGSHYKIVGSRAIYQKP